MLCLKLSTINSKGGSVWLMHHAYLIVHEQAVVQLKGIVCCVVDKIQKALESPANQNGV